jgi:hypothetical protein
LIEVFVKYFFSTVLTSLFQDKNGQANRSETAFYTVLSDEQDKKTMSQGLMILKSTVPDRYGSYRYRTIHMTKNMYLSLDAENFQQMDVLTRGPGNSCHFR